MQNAILLSLLLWLPLSHIFSQEREMRGVWVATVTNIDFPSRKTLSTWQQKNEIQNILNQHKADGINAIFFQVRPAADAFYASETEPWSRYLNGEQGKAPQPFYDPLSYIIEEAHKRNMELHAWINPFRVKLNAADSLSAEHPYVKHPTWGWDYGGKTFFDPGLPEVRTYVKEVIIDIVKRYDIDGIHFDDYFYPYRSDKNDTLPDEETFRKYGTTFYPDKIEDWRRENISCFIHNVSKTIKAEKKWVKFGISPFGIWKNSRNPSDSLPTKGKISSYDILYADVIKWLKEGWIDYAAPQLYWAIGFAPADFEKLLSWWGEHSYSRHLYIGHGLYKIDSLSKEEAWRNSIEIDRQIKALRRNDNVAGSIFYSSKHLTQRTELKPLREALKNDFYKDDALMPWMPWIDKEPPAPPRALHFVNVENRLVWKAPKYKDEMNKAHLYAVYKVKSRKHKNEAAAENMIGLTRQTYFPLPLDAKDGYYVVKALDRLHNESKAQLVQVRQHQLYRLTPKTPNLK